MHTYNATIGADPKSFRLQTLEPVVQGTLLDVANFKTFKVETATANAGHPASLVLVRENVSPNWTGVLVGAVVLGD